MSVAKPSGALLSPATELAHSTRRQIAVRLLPFLFVLYIANYLDRTSVAYAALGMTGDLGFSDRVFGLGAGIFFLSYVALQIPGAMIVEHWSARRMIAVVMIAWGSLTALTGLVHTANQLYIARLLLGAAEAGFFPGVIVYLSHWFGTEDRGKATGYFMAAIPLSQALASPLAGWIVAHSFHGLQGWRWLFILEGFPAVLLGAIAYFYLCDWPRDARWLASARREWIDERLRREKLATPQAISVMQALRSRVVLLLATVCFLNYFVAYGFYFWFPTMLKRQSSLSTQLVGLIGMIPYLVDVCGHDPERAPLRPAHGEALAFRCAHAHRGDRSFRPRCSSPLTACCRFAFHYDRVFQCLSPHVLGHSYVAARPLRRCGCGRLYQRRGVCGRFRLSVSAGLSEHANGVLQRGNVCDHGRRHRLRPPNLPHPQNRPQLRAGVMLLD